ncbi:MAG: TIGR00282 family metallophosphoesterase [Capsulimonas sp.]|uniref:TIGR00282 family metallophosphoesterase n=1 Tax=Capsulimonas sp. TaxID=2494211 RepID=UPI003262ED0F
MRILMLGDVVGKVGREAAETMLPTLKEMYSPQFTIVNGENAAAGLGITPEIARSLLRNGADVITLGNHTWNRRDIVPYLDQEPRILRPANYPPGTAGSGYRVFTAENGVRVGVANMMGRVFMEALDDPFRTADKILESFQGQTKISFFDFHGEATSEKTAFGYYLDGRASVVVGTHTHVQTADERILPKGTAYITDVGMCGPQDSIIGMNAEIVVQKFVTQMPNRFEVAEGGVVLCGIVADVDPDTGHATQIQRVQIRDIH